MIRVAHLIHTTGIGGVEAAVDLISHSTSALDYRVLAFAEGDPSVVQADVIGSGVNSVRSIGGLLTDMRRSRPEVVVSSLWRSVLVGGLHRFHNLRTPWVVYIHNSRYTNPVDALIHRISFHFADRILCDSTAALESLVPTFARSRAEVVRPDSVLLQMARARSADEVGQAANGRNHVAGTTPDFESAAPIVGGKTATANTETFPHRRRLAYWGRAVEQKRLDRALDLLSVLEELAPARFALDIICPKSALLEGILESARERSLPVTWLGPRSAAGIIDIAASATFFLQLSEFEGLAMSVREALALGLVPVITCVGEIGNYTEDDRDSVHVAGTDAASRDGITPEDYVRAALQIISLDSDPIRLEAMSRSALDVPGGSFVEEFETAIAATLGRESRKTTALAKRRVTIGERDPR